MGGSIRPSVPPPGSARPYLTVVIPAYNEARRIAASLEELCAYLSAQPYSSEVLVVDDGSKDDTAGIVASFAHDHAVRLHRLETNRGKGAAVRNGILRADGDVIVFVDADLSAAPTEIPALLRPIRDGADVVLASRVADRSRVERSLARRFISRAFNLTVRAILSLDVADTQCGFKAFQRQAAHRIFREQQTDGFAFDCEVILIAARQGWKLSEVPVRWVDKPGSTLNAASPLHMILELLSIRWRVARLRPRADGEFRPRRTHVPSATRAAEDDEIGPASVAIPPAARVPRI